jgi:hypothetical protein
MEYRDYKIANDGTYGYKEIKSWGKGSVHLTLRGVYTSYKVAMAAIDFYEDNVRVAKGGKAD